MILRQTTVFTIASSFGSKYFLYLGKYRCGGAVAWQYNNKKQNRFGLFLLESFSPLLQGVQCLAALCFSKCLKVNGQKECAPSLYNLLEMLYHNIDNFTSQAAPDYSSNNYLVDRNRILGLICQRDVRCVDVVVLIQTRCLNLSSFVTENIWKMGIKFAEIPRDLLILCCWEGGGRRLGKE